MPKTLAQVKTYSADNAKYTYGATNGNFFSKNQLAYAVETQQNAIAETITQEALHLNIFTLSLIESKLHPFVSDSLVSHEAGILRSGYAQRKYGKILPAWMKEYPAPGQPVTIEASPRLQMRDDYTGSDMWKLEAKQDRVLFREREAFIDSKDYDHFNNYISSVVSDSISCAYNVAGAAFLLATYPAVTLSEDANLIPFLDQTLRPDQNKHKQAYQWYDKDGKFWKLIKEQVIDQTQKKFKNITTYSTVFYNPLIDEGTQVKEPHENAITYKDNETDWKKRYLVKDNDNYKTHPSNNRWISLLALSMTIRSWVAQMTKSDTVRNMASFDPSAQQQPTDMQEHGYVDITDLALFLNPLDYEELQVANSNTSAMGNYSIGIQDLVARGLTVYTHDVIMPCDFKLIQKGTFLLNNIFSAYYHEKMDWARAEQFGYHDFTIPMVLGLGVGVACSALDACPSPMYLNKNYKSLKPE